MRRTMSCSRLLGLALGMALASILAIFLEATPGLAQQQTGDLFGTVVDEQKAPLPGVNVTLTGTGAPQVQQTDEGGRFRFVGLYPGTYAIKAELEGFGSVDYPNIGVRVGGKAEVEVTLSSAVKEMITVTDEAPLLDERQTSRGSNLPSTELNKLPTARDPWSLLTQAPGVQVDRFNIGGNESGQQSNFLGTGSAMRDNVFTVDGVVLTDMNAVGGSATYFDFGAFEEVQFTTSSTDVSVATAGVTINQVTKRGTNTWRMNGRYLRTDGQLQSEPSLENGNKIDSVEEYGADIGGPLMKDHLWIWGSYGKSDIRNQVPSPVAGAGRLFDHTVLEDYNGKLNFQLGAHNSGVVHYWTNDKLKFGRQLAVGFFGAPLQEATHNQTTPSDIVKVEDTFIPSARLILTALWSRDDGKFTLTPRGGLDVDMYTDTDFVVHGSSFDFKQDATIDQGRLDGSFFASTGSVNHELKFGAGFRQQENSSTSTFPHHRRVVLLTEPEPGAEQQVIFSRDRVVNLRSSYDSAWLQDTLQQDRWTANVGVRYDRQYGRNLPSSLAANPQAQGTLPPLSFGGNDAGGFTWNTLVPRLAVTYAAGADRKTLLRATFSRYAEQLGQNPQLTRASPASGYSYSYFYFADANGNRLFDESESPSLVYSYTYGFDPNDPLHSADVNDKNLKPYITDELTFGVEHAFTSDLVLGATLTLRNIHDIAEERPFVVDDATGQTRLATRDDYESKSTPVTATLPNGNEVALPIYQLREGLSATGGALLTNGDREEDYSGVTVSLQRRLRNHWSARGYVSYNDWKWKIGKQFKSFDNPTDIVSDRLGYSDSPEVYAEGSGGSKSNVFTSGKWSFNLNGLYQVAPDRPWGFDVGANLSARQGYPAPPLKTRQSGDPLGRRTVQLTHRLDDFRYPNAYTLDAHVGKDVSLGDFTLSFTLDGFNLLNADTELQHELDARVTRYLDTTENLSPRIFRVGVIFRWN